MNNKDWVIFNHLTTFTANLQPVLKLSKSTEHFKEDSSEASSQEEGTWLCILRVYFLIGTAN